MMKYLTVSIIVNHNISSSNSYYIALIGVNMDHKTVILFKKEITWK